MSKPVVPPFVATFYVGIDVETKSKAKVIKRLRALKSTISVEDLGAYREEKSCSKIHVVTERTAGQVDDWCWKTKGIDYFGTFLFA